MEITNITGGGKLGFFDKIDNRPRVIVDVFKQFHDRNDHQIFFTDNPAN